jgi:hypothetical protein
VTFREPEPEATSKKNTVVNERTMTKTVKLQIPTFQFEDIMLATYRKNVAVEVYFKAFGRKEKELFTIDKETFFESMKGLNLKWVDTVTVSNLFDAIDHTSHN